MHRRKLTADEIQESDAQIALWMAEAGEEVDAAWPMLSVELPAFFREFLGRDPLVTRVGNVVEIRSDVEYPAAAMASKFQFAAKCLNILDGDRKILIEKPELFRIFGKAALRIRVREEVPTFLTLKISLPIPGGLSRHSSSPLRVWTEADGFTIRPDAQA